MLVEVDYPDGNGICPFCGDEHFEYAGSEQQDCFDGYTCTAYACTCSLGHVFFTSTENIINNDYNYIRFYQRMFVHFQDWEDHIDMTIEPGAFHTPLLDNEDDAWVINQKLIKKIQDQK